MRSVRPRLRWALAPTDRRTKAAVLVGAVPLGIAVAALAAAAGATMPLAIAAGAASAAVVLAVAVWLLAPATTAALVRVERIRVAQRELHLAVRASAPRRANIVLPTVDLPHFFGGYIGVFNLARRLAERGVRVRLVTAEPQPPLPATWRDELGRYEGVGRALDLVEIEFAGDGRAPLEVSPDDWFVAVSAWTAYVSHRATRRLGRPHFIHVIQDYDALGFPSGSLGAIARAAYDLPHRAVFSTEPLRDYFRSRRLGVFAAGAEAGQRDSVVFRSAITPVGPVGTDVLTRRTDRALLMYARADDHAARNMFELAIVALADAIEAGVFAGDWRFAGIGSLRPLGPIDLPGGRRLELLPRTTQREYAALLGEFSVGLSLMDTPHPSLVPIEMAAAGLVAVTSTFADKDATRLSAISPNLVPCPPTVEGVVAGLREAVARRGDVDARARGSHVDWPSTWDDAFDEEVVGRIAGWLGAP